MWEWLISDLPVIVFLFLHFEHDPIAPVIRDIDMKKIIGKTGQQPEIKFPQAVGCFDQLGEVNVSCKGGEVHMSSLLRLTINPRALFA